jgi:hypothetical protein
MENEQEMKELIVKTKSLVEKWAPLLNPTSSLSNAILMEAQQCKLPLVDRDGNIV